MNLRTHQCPSGSSTSRDSEPLSACTKANGRLSLAWRHSSPMTPPWTTAATRRARLGALDHPRQAGARALREGLHRLGAGDDVPALLREDLADDRVAAAHGDPKRAAVELAEVDLAQLGHDDGFESGQRGERRGGLRGAPQRRDEERGQRLAGEVRRHGLGLALAGVRQRRVGLALEQLERLVLDGRLGRAVADEHDLDRARRARVVLLRVLACAATARAGVADAP